MQFVEKNSLNVRSAIYRLTSKDSPIVFVLFPMIHIGSKDFFEEISRKLENCDIILAEGIGESKKVNLLTSSYRIVRYIKRMDLVTQQEGINFAQFSHKIFDTDVSGKDFDSDWSSLPLIFRLQMFLLVPVYVIYLFIFGTRKTIAENIAVENLPTSEEIFYQDENIEKLDYLVVDRRDQKLIREIEKIYQSDVQNEKVVAIVYGAIHMRNITKYLMGNLKYRSTDSEWITVFDL